MLMNKQICIIKMKNYTKLQNNHDTARLSLCYTNKALTTQILSFECVGFQTKYRDALNKFVGPGFIIGQKVYNYCQNFNCFSFKIKKKFLKSIPRALAYLNLCTNQKCD